MPRLRSTLIAAGILAVALPIGASVTDERDAPRPTAETADESTLGMRPSGSFLREDRLSLYERQLGGPISWYVAMAGRQSPEEMRSSVWGQLKNPDAVLPEVADRMNLVMTVPLAFGKNGAKTDEGRTRVRAALLETASGKWDDAFVAVAKALVEGGYPDAVIRLGHEFSGHWYPWSAQGNPDAYVEAYRHVHEVMRKVSPEFTFEWNAARKTFIEHGPDAYPGDEYVDVVGLDVYYEPSKADPGEFTDDVWEDEYASILRAHRDFAIARSKPLSYAEWGNGNIDEPEFIQQMHDWFSSLPSEGGGRLLYHSYFNVTRQTYDLEQYPRSKARYLELFGIGGGDRTDESSVTPADAPDTRAPRTTPPPSTSPPTASTSPGPSRTTTPSTTTTPPTTTPARPSTSTTSPRTPASAVPTSDPADADSAAQITFLRETVTHEANSAATFRRFDAPRSWQRGGFVDGSVFLRLEIVDKPSELPVEVLVCASRDRFAQQACASAGVFTEQGVNWVTLGPPSRWWTQGPWQWDGPIEVVRLVVKDAATKTLLSSRKCGNACYRGNQELLEHTPIVFDAEMIVVAAGARLAPPARWYGCPDEFRGLCSERPARP